MGRERWGRAHSARRPPPPARADPTSRARARRRGPSPETPRAGAARVCQVRPSCARPRCPGGALLREEPRSCPPGASEGSAAGRERRGAQVANGPPCHSRGFSRALVAPPARPPDLPPPQTPNVIISPSCFGSSEFLQLGQLTQSKLTCYEVSATE
ncbi:atherin-like [Mus pahari]|uniref:atherin-like n=1 Tax=Mus pahari TaxID=10093 RepID=UPI000A31147E|nr:atherin-like [Mus pahari]